ncbi:MAG: hypothetical protein SWX82_28870 [Cyanobacteriota bacterium]|nr:hypothetical protein [Cyanobacteriota bacterium]
MNSYCIVGSGGVGEWGSGGVGEWGSGGVGEWVRLNIEVVIELSTYSI